MTKAQAWAVIGILAIIAIAVSAVVVSKQSQANSSSKVATSSATSEAATSSAKSNVENTSADYYQNVYKVVCSGAINTFAECSPMVTANILFHVLPAYGEVTSRNEDLPPNLAPVMTFKNCSFANGQNWSCVDAQGNTEGFRNGSYFSDSQTILNEVPQRKTTILVVTHDQYQAANLYLSNSGSVSP